MKWWQDLIVTLYSKVFLITNYPQLISNIFPGSSQLKAEINIDALKDRIVSRIYKGKVYIRKKILWCIPVYTTITERTVNSTADMLPVDGASGGLYDMMMGVEIPSSFQSAIKKSRFCFVPTVSSLALDDWQTKLTQNLSSGVLSTSFDRTFAQGDNSFHIKFSPYASFLYNELTTNIQSVISNQTFSVSNPNSRFAFPNYTGEGENIPFIPILQTIDCLLRNRKLSFRKMKFGISLCLIF